MMRSLVMASLMVYGLPINAQAVSYSLQSSNEQQKPATPAGRITVSFTNTPIGEAIRTIATQSGTMLVYDAAKLPARSVTYRRTGVTVFEALNGVLLNTGLKAEPGGEGRIKIVPERSARATQGVISGKVTDSKTSRGISGATVSIGNNTHSAVTGEDGAYRITGITAGAHTVQVRMVGYAKQNRSVEVGEGTAVIADFKLEPSANVLDQVIVTGTVVQTELRSVPNAITVVTAKQIEERGITRIDQLFRGEIPGLFSSETGTGSLLDEVVMFSRGATNIKPGGSAGDITNSIKTYVDGIELADPQYLSQIDPRSIERIEILTGPQASTIYGSNAINGVMQIFTKRGSTIRPSITLNLSSGLIQNNLSSALTSSHSSDASVSGTEGRFSYNVGGGWNYTGPWSPAKQMQRTSAYGGGNYQLGSLSLDFSTRQGWTQNKIDGNTFQLRTEMAENGKYIYSVNISSGLATPEKRALNGQTLSLTLKYTPLSWWSHQLSLGSDASDIDQLGSAAAFKSPTDTSFTNVESRNHKLSQSYSSTIRFSLSSLTQATVTYGLDHWRAHYSSVGWSMSDKTLTPSSIIRNKPGKNSGTYVQGQFGLLDQLFLTYGVRADWNPNFGEKAKVRPGRYGVSYSRDFGVVSAKIRGSYGRSIRPPADGEILGTFANTVVASTFGPNNYSNLPNPELGPEFQQGGEGGIELYFGSRGSFVVTRYNQTVDGLINSVSPIDSVRALEPGLTGISGCGNSSNLRSDGYCYLVQGKNMNVGSIRNQGWELQSNVNLGSFAANGTYSWATSRVIGVTPKYRALLTSAAFTPGGTFLFVPEHTWAMNISYVQKGTSLSLNVNGVGNILHDLSALGGAEIGLLTSGDLRLRVTDTPRMSVGASFRQAHPGYTTVNMNALRRIATNIDGTLQVTNLTNFYQNDVDAFRPVIGRRAQLGVRLRLN